MDVVYVGTVWLHLVATVALIGYYASLGLLIIPVLRRSLPETALAGIIVIVERRALPVIVGSVAVLIVTGASLTGIGPAVASPSSGPTWTTMILVKHVAVGVFVVLGVYADGLIARRIDAPAIDTSRAAVQRLAHVAQAMTALGLLVLLLTAAAQEG